MDSPPYDSATANPPPAATPRNAKPTDTPQPCSCPPPGPDRFLHLVTGRRPTDEDKAITRLATEFDVIPQAMRFRLVSLNLIDPA
jgi:hypothetical protein